MSLAGTLLQQNSSDAAQVSPAARAPEYRKKIEKEKPEQTPGQESRPQAVSEQKFSQHLVRESSVAERKAEENPPEQASGGFVSKSHAVVSTETQEMQPQEAQQTVPESSVVQATEVSGGVSQTDKAAVAPETLTQTSPETPPVVEGDANIIAGQSEFAPETQETTVSAAPAEVADTQASAVEKPKAAALGVVLPRTDPEADASPIILVKAQVERLADHLLGLSLQSRGPSDTGVTPQLAIEVYGLVDAITKVAQSLDSHALQGRDNLVALPSEALPALEALIELQNLLDADSVASLLGFVPQLRLATPEQITQITQDSAQWADVALPENAVFVVLNPLGQNTSVLPLAKDLADSPVVASKGVASKGVAPAPAAQPVLPEWLQDAAVQPATRGYGRDGSSTASVQPPQSVPNTTPHTVSVDATVNNTAASGALASSLPPQGAVLKQSLDQKAAQYMQAQSHTLPRHLRPLVQVPAVDSPDYPAWVEKVASVIHQAGFTHLNATAPSGGAATYVFEEPEITRLLQMLPVAALRDVVRGAGKLSRRVAAQEALVRSQGAVQQMQQESRQLQQSLHTTSASETVSSATEFRAGFRQQTQQGNIASHTAPQATGMAATVSGLATADPTTANRTAERDVRALPRKRSNASGIDKPAATQARQMVENAEAQPRAFDGQQRISEAEILRQGAVSTGDAFEATPSTQKSEAFSSTQAAQVQRQAQLARIAQHIRAQVTMQVLRQAQSEAETVELQLNPRRLGKISIQLVREASSKMVINFAIENPETLEALRNNIDDLLQSLREAGISTDRGAMNFTLKEENRQAFEQKQKKNTVPDIAEEDEEAVLEIGQLADIDADGHVNVRV